VHVACLTDVTEEEEVPRWPTGREGFGGELVYDTGYLYIFVFVGSPIDVGLLRSGRHVCSLCCDSCESCDTVESMRNRLVDFGIP
jgi:hypothetical protein